MKEYWVNVYSNGDLGLFCNNKYLTEEIANLIVYDKPVYRIHVKIKEKYPNHPLTWNVA
jgi:hypothetical protein